MIINRDSLDLSEKTHKNLLIFMSNNFHPVSQEYSEVNGKMYNMKSYNIDEGIEILTRKIDNVRPNHVRFLPIWKEYLRILGDVNDRKRRSSSYINYGI